VIRGALTEQALRLDPNCKPARDNLALLQQDLPTARPEAPTLPATPPAEPSRPARVALVSLLFNWPSAGGGNIHTAELAHFLARAGYPVRHFFARFAPWNLGAVSGELPHSQALEFAEADWNGAAIGARFRAAVDAFAPDCVIISDSWNMKPHLAVALSGYPVLLRFQALECLCPLNNVRLLSPAKGLLQQCDRDQLSDPANCAACLRQHGHTSGALHQAERQLAGWGSSEYQVLLYRALREAAAVLALNPEVAALLGRFAPRVQVVPWGMDPDRFPWPTYTQPPPARPRKVVLMAGLVEEPMKGFNILHAACAKLWTRRKDFELVATAEPAGRVDEWTRYAGWLGQKELPQLYAEADVVAVPTVAQEGLSRTSAEAMAAGRPVVASRIGGLPSTVVDGQTGLLCEPGSVEDLASKLDLLLSDEGLRRQMGQAGRKRFEEHFSWPVVIDTHYRPLLDQVKNSPRPAGTELQR
jgi:glycosyltransferase involved in cell wall biosynthesis